MINIDNFYIYEPSSIVAIHNALRNYSKFVFSEYFTLSNLKLDQSHGKTQFQDLHTLTFKNESFDLILTLDVFEHKKDPLIAFKGVYRVLKPKGFHFFAVPIENHRKTIKRIDNKNKILLKPIIYYNGNISIKRPKVYTDFSLDINQNLDKFGFSTFNLSLK